MGCVVGNVDGKYVSDDGEVVVGEAEGPDVVDADEVVSVVRISIGSFVGLAVGF